MRRHLHAVMSVAGALFALLANAKFAGAQAGADEQREHFAVTDVSFSGVHAVDKSDLEKSIVTQASSCKGLLLEPFCLFTKSHTFYTRRYLDPLELQRDVLRIRVFYWRRGYREAAVDTIVKHDHPQQVALEFRITEGAPTLVHTITVLRPDSALSTQDIEQAMALRAGKPLDLIKLDSSLTLLRNTLWDRGYADAKFTDSVAVNDTTRSADIRIATTPGFKTTIDSVVIRGNKGVSRHTIDHLLTVHQGDLYRPSQVVQSTRNLYASNLFRRAAIVVPPSPDSAKTMLVEVQEAKTREVRLSGGFNTIDFVQVEARYTNYNWVGGGRRLDVRGVLSNLFAPVLNGVGIFRNAFGDKSVLGDSADLFLKPNYTASIDVTQPGFRSLRNTLGFSIFTHRRSAPSIYIDEGYGASPSFTRLVSDRTSLSFVYRYEQTKVVAGDVYFCVNYGVCEPATIRALNQRASLSPVSINLFADRSDDPLNPTRGYQYRVDLEHASRFTLSDFQYNRIYAEVMRYQRIGHSTLAGRIAVGWVRPLSGASLSDTTDILHPRTRFYAGGAQSVRGYGENQLGPRILTVDPAKLLAVGCTNATIASGDCNPGGVISGDFDPRPTGGTSLLEGNIEYRFPLMKQLGGAVFLDGAFVGEGSLQDVTKGAGALTPGFGIRYITSAGAIRLDLGIRPSLTENLSVLTQITNPDGSTELVTLKQPKAYNPLEGSNSVFRQVIDRLQLHLSIGQAF